MSVTVAQSVARSLRTRGFFGTLSKAGARLLMPVQRRVRERRIFSHRNIEDRFTHIYRANYWGNAESVSGTGSSLSNTEQLRENLPKLYEQYSIASVLDAPCGDFHWMKHVQDAHPLDYTGADIVAPLIASLRHKYGNSRTRFIHLDLTKDEYPQADLLINRDCLFHLSYADTRLALERFINSRITYLLTTTHVNARDFVNRDIRTGDFRRIDLFSAPYNFPTAVLFRFPDARLGEPKETELCLWTRDQIAAALEAFQV